MAYFDHFATSRGTAVGEWITGRSVEREFRFLVQSMPSRRAVEILEIGPGRGRLAQRFLSAGYGSYDVVEPNDIMRAEVQHLGVRTTSSYRIPNLAEKDESYDVIVACDVFEHLNDSAEAQHFVAEARRVLRPGGLVFIVSPDLMDWKEDFYNCDFSHSNPTTVRRVHEMFLNEGLETVGFKYAYACLDGVFGYVISRTVKLLTFWTSGENLGSKPYKLRLTFLRRFLIIGRKASLT